MTMHKAKGLEFPHCHRRGADGASSAASTCAGCCSTTNGVLRPARTILKSSLRRRRSSAPCAETASAAGARRTRCAFCTWRSPARASGCGSPTAKRPPAFTGGIADAGCFADFIDLADFEENIVPVFGEERGAPAARVLLTGEPDEEARRAVSARYRRSIHSPRAAVCPSRRARPPCCTRRARRGNFCLRARGRNSLRNAPMPHGRTPPRGFRPRTRRRAWRIMPFWSARTFPPRPRRRRRASSRACGRRVLPSCPIPRRQKRSCACRSLPRSRGQRSAANSPPRHPARKLALRYARGGRRARAGVHRPARPAGRGVRRRGL